MNKMFKSSDLSRRANFREPSTIAIESKRPVSNDRYAAIEMANDGSIWLSAPDRHQLASVLRPYYNTFGKDGGGDL